MRPFAGRSFLRQVLLAPLVLVVLSSPLRGLFACDLMGGAAQPACCCEQSGDTGCAMGGDCADPMGAGDGCCETVTDVTATAYAVPSMAGHSVRLLEAPQPPPAAPLPASIHSLLADPPAVSPKPRSRPLWSAGTQTYLITLRLRR